MFIFWRCRTLRITIIVCFAEHPSFNIFHLFKRKKITLRSHVLLKPFLVFVIWLFKTNNINSVKTPITNKNTLPNEWRLEWNRSETTRNTFLELVIKEEGSSLSAHDEFGAWVVSTHQVWGDRPQDQCCDYLTYGNVAYPQGPWPQWDVKTRSLQLFWVLVCLCKFLDWRGIQQAMREQDRACWFHSSVTKELAISVRWWG